MKIDAVQNERDIIGKRQRTSSLSNAVGCASSGNGIAVSATKVSARHASFSKQPSSSSIGHYSPPSTSSSPGAYWDTPKMLLESLLAAEKSIQSLRDTVIKQTSGVEYAKQEPTTQTSDGERKATVNDIFLSIHSQLLLVIEWAKTLPPFAALSTDDQTALLKSFACQHVVLCVTYRSKNNSDMLKLINDSCIPRLQGAESLFPERFYVRDCERLMDELVAPMRFLHMDDIEFVAMKACVLFNPVAKGLSSGSVMQVLATRRQIFSALEHYVDTKIPGDANRIGDLTFFILSPLQSLANMISEDILVSKLSGVAHIDQLMEELILADTGDEKILPNRFQNNQALKESIDATALGSRLSNPEPAAEFMQCATTAPGIASTPASPEAALSEFEDPRVMRPFSNFSPSVTLSSYVLGPLNSSQPASPELDMMAQPAGSPTVYQNSWDACTITQSNLVNNESIFVTSGLNF